MPTCPRCGSQVAEDASFCTSCGAPLGRSAAQGAAAPQGRPSPPPYPPYYSPPPKSDGLRIILIILAIIAVAVVAIAAIGAFFIVNEANAGNVDMRVNGVEPYTGPGTPAEGYERVVLNVTMANHRNYDIPVDLYFFRLQAGGSDYRPIESLPVNSTVPSSIPPGQERAFSVVFDIPQGADPTTLRYNIYIVNVSANVP